MYFSSSTTGDEVVKAFSKQAEGKTIVITGPSERGLGAQSAIYLAAANPKHIILAGRTESDTTPVIEEMKKVNPKVTATFVKLDLADLSSVRKAAEEINASVEKIDLLINNAGVMAIKDYTKSKDGYEMQFATNHLGHFLLTNLVMGKILAAAPGSRIVNLTSLGYASEEIRFDDWNFSDGKTYNPWLGYGQSKTANILFTLSLTEKLKGKGIFSYAVHPGIILDTGIMTGVTQEMFADGFRIAGERNGGVPPPMDVQKNAEAGCATTLVAALDPSLNDKPGAFLKDCDLIEKQMPIKPWATSPEAAEKLWALSERLVGQNFSYSGVHADTQEVKE